MFQTCLNENKYSVHVQKISILLMLSSKNVTTCSSIVAFIVLSRSVAHCSLYQTVTWVKTALPIKF